MLRFQRGRLSRSSGSTSTPARSSSSTRARATSSTSRRPRIAAARANGFDATADFARAARGRCDHHLRADAAQQVPRAGPELRRRHRRRARCRTCARARSLSLESTTYPGTTDEELRPRVEATRAQGRRGHLPRASRPSARIPGNADFVDAAPSPRSAAAPRRPAWRSASRSTARSIDQVVPVSSTRAAEMTKLLENIHRAVNIGLVNEMKIVADRMGIDIHEVIRAAATKPFGFVPYYPGPGLGGHCIPIDPFYLTWKAREYGVHTRFIELAGEINRSDAGLGGRQGRRRAQRSAARRSRAAASWCWASPTRRTSTTCASRPRSC